MTRSAILLLFLALCMLVLPTCARAEVRYTITDRGTLGGKWSYAGGINDSGSVVGFLHPEAYDIETALGLLPTPHYKLGAQGSAACALDNAQGFMSHDSTLEIATFGTTYLQVTLFDASGNAMEGGSRDYVRKAVKG